MKRLAALVVVALAVVVAQADDADAAAVGRCPQWEPLLADRGLPVRAFSRIMYRESRCRPSAVHRNRNGTIDRGLVQINSIHLRGAARGLPAAALFDPSVNLDVAARLYHRSGLRPWRATG